MAFKRLDPEDFVVSSDSVTSTLWSTGAPTITQVFTSSTHLAGSTGDFYLNVYQTESMEPTAANQFSITYCNSVGSGSILYNSAVDGNSPTKTIYNWYS